jgi:hypothetical protein
MDNITPSEEQCEIINTISKRKNICIQAVAGSGKTTTALFIAKAFPNKNILLLTYNAKLKIETRKKVKDLKYTNIDVESYHSFCVKHYDKKCYTDAGIIKLNEVQPLIPKEKFHYNIIIADESQDLTFEYFKVLCNIYYYCHKSILILLGDTRQMIYQFNKADNRYLMYPKEIFKRKFTHLSLSTTYRLSNEVCDFVNHCILLPSYNKKEKLQNNKLVTLKGTKSGDKPRWFICDAFGDDVYYEVYNYLQTYKIDDIMILAPTIKSIKSPVRKLANKLSKEGICVYVPINENEKIDENVAKNKMIFSTFHQAKGLERKVVIVYGVDANYHLYFGKGINPVYVACTRCIEKMTLVHHYKSDVFHTFPNNFTDYVYIYKKRHLEIENSFSKRKYIYTIRELTEYVPTDIILELVKNIDTTIVKKKGNSINLSNTVKQQKTTEWIKHITDLSILLYLELTYKYKKSLPSKSNILSIIKQKTNFEIERKDKYSIPWYLEVCNHFYTCMNGFKNNLIQIKQYDWLTQEILDWCYDKFVKFGLYEKNITFNKEYSNEFETFMLSDYIAIVSDNTVYYIAFDNIIEPIEYIKAIIMLYLTKTTTGYVCNITNGQIIKIECDINNQEKIIKELLLWKHGENITTKHQFIKQNKKFIKNLKNKN